MDKIVVGSIKSKRESFEALKFNLNDAEQVAAGILWGAVEAEGLDNIKGCIQGAELIFDDVKAAMQDFEEETPEGTIAGLKELADTIFAIGNEAMTCKGVIADFEKIGELAAIFSNPVSLVYHIAKDCIVNGV